MPFLKVILKPENNKIQFKYLMVTNPRRLKENQTED